VLSGAVSGSDRLLIFGGEGEPKRSKASAEAVGPAMMNDLWTVALDTGAAANRIATHGAPPTPRRQHALAAFKEPAPLASPAVDKFKQTTLGMTAATRCATTSADAAKRRNVLDSGRGGAVAGAVGVTKATRFMAGGEAGAEAHEEGTVWTVLCIGGRTGAASGCELGAEEALHVLRVDESGHLVAWQSSLEVLRAATCRRLADQRASTHSQQLIRTAEQRAEGHLHEVSPPAAGAPQGSSRARVEAAQASDADLARAVEAGRTAFATLNRYAHTAVPVGGVALVFGGLQHGVPTASLVSVRWRDLATGAVSTQGQPPAPRYAHAACADPSGGMVVCGGRDAGPRLRPAAHAHAPRTRAYAQHAHTSSGAARPLAAACWQLAFGTTCSC
jgi:hypothetical protein